MTKRESDLDPASSAGRLLRDLGISAAKSTASNSSCRRPGPDAGPASSSNDNNEIELDDFACRRRHRASTPADEEQTRLPTGSPFTRPPHRRSSSVTSLESAASTSSTTSTSSLWSLFAPFSHDSRGHTLHTDVSRTTISRDTRRQDAADQVWRDYW